DDDDEVRLELVDDLLLLSEIRPVPLAIALAGGQSHVVADLVEHAGRPIALVAPFRIDARRVDDALPGRGESLVGSRQRRMMRGADTENLTHARLLGRSPSLGAHSIADSPPVRS